MSGKSESNDGERQDVVRVGLRPFVKMKKRKSNEVKQINYNGNNDWSREETISGSNVVSDDYRACETASQWIES
jgi:hypothetical protein